MPCSSGRYRRHRQPSHGRAPGELSRFRDRIKIPAAVNCWSGLPGIGQRKSTEGVKVEGGGLGANAAIPRVAAMAAAKRDFFMIIPLRLKCIRERQQSCT